jgi:hypothetical protein
MYVYVECKEKELKGVEIIYYGHKTLLEGRNRNLEILFIYHERDPFSTGFFF